MKQWRVRAQIGMVLLAAVFLIGLTVLAACSNQKRDAQAGVETPRHIEGIKLGVTLAEIRQKVPEARGWEELEPEHVSSPRGSLIEDFFEERAYGVMRGSRYSLSLLVAEEPATCELAFDEAEQLS